MCGGGDGECKKCVKKTGTFSKGCFSKWSGFYNTVLSSDKIYLLIPIEQRESVFFTLLLINDNQKKIIDK